jgi:hypothetical protein
MEEQVLGYGGECVALAMPGEPDKVYKFMYNKLSPVEAEEIYCLQAIAHTLFPNHFPDIYAAFGTEEDDPPYVTGTIQQRIHIARDAGMRDQGEDVKCPFPVLDDEKDAMDIPLHLDATMGNFFLDTKGKVVYLDRVTLEYGYCDVEKTFRTMRERGYDAADCARVVQAVGRLAAYGIAFLPEGQLEKVSEQVRDYTAENR